MRKQQRRFRGLKLRSRDAKRLKVLQADSSSALVHKRIVALRLLACGKRISEVADMVGMYPRAIRRVAWGYIDEGLDAALFDKARPKPLPSLSVHQKQAIVALCCTPAPEGRSRWTVRLLAQEAVERGVVPKTNRESVRMILADHELKPWREKNVVRSEARR